MNYFLRNKTISKKSSLIMQIFKIGNFMVIYRDLRLSYRQPCMKREMAWCVERCLTCRMVKTEHQRLHGKLLPFEVPMWKQEQINMVFITKFSRKTKGFDVIWVIVDQLTKSVNFLAIWESSSADVYVRQIVTRHGVQVSIVFDRDVWFTSRIQQRFHEELRTRLHFNTNLSPSC